MNFKEHPPGAGFKFKWPRVLLKSADLFCPHSYLAHTLKMPEEDLCKKPHLIFHLGHSFVSPNNNDLCKKTRLIFHLGHSFVSPNNKPSSAFYKIAKFAFKRFLFSPPFFLLYYLFICSRSNFLTITQAEMLTFSQLACLRPQENLTCLSLPRRKTTMRMPVKQASSQMLKAIQPKQIWPLLFFSVLIKKPLPTELKWHGKSKLISIWSLQAVLLSNYKF